MTIPRSCRAGLGEEISRRKENAMTEAPGMRDTAELRARYAEIMDEQEVDIAAWNCAGAEIRRVLEQASSFANEVAYIEGVRDYSGTREVALKHKAAIDALLSRLSGEVERPSHYPSCNLNWSVFPPAEIEGANGRKTGDARCVECKSVYSAAPLRTDTPASAPALDPATVEKVPEKRAPVQGFSAGIPWSMHLRAYDAYCKKYGRQQALIEGGCRGGFHTGELDQFIPGWRDELSEITALRARIAELEAATLSAPASVPQPVVPEPGIREALRQMDCPRPCNGRPDGLSVGECFDNLECGCDAGFALAAAPASAPQPVVPPGWQLVPIEPTPEMIGAGHQAIDALYYSGDELRELSNAVYRAMIAAATQPADAGGRADG